MNDQDCYLVTYTGRRVNPLNLKPEDICIEDIAHSLACSNRFLGHTKEPINIAQHSVFVSVLVESWCKQSHLTPGHLLKSTLQGLLHDASEYILGDITKWFKQTEVMKGYRELEERTQATIYSLWNLPHSDTEEVKFADRTMVRYEAMWMYDVYPITQEGYERPTLKDQIWFSQATRELGAWTPWSWMRSERIFLERFHSLQRRIQKGA